MPTYWYRCQTCHHEFDEFQKISDPPVKECPKCNGIVMRVITGGSGLVFKGSGFYITDYRKESYKKDAKTESGSSSSPSSDAKPSGSSSSSSSKSE